MCVWQLCLIFGIHLQFLTKYQIARENKDNVAITKEKVNKTCENRFKQSLILVLYTLIFNYD